MKMKKKILIIVSIIVILFAIICGIIIHRNTVKPIVTWHGFVGDFTDFYELEIQIYENGKCKLIGNGNEIGQTVSFKIEKDKIEELQRKIDELKFRDISEHITISVVDYPTSYITVNYKDQNSHRVVRSEDVINDIKGEQWERDNYGELSKEIWSLVPKEKRNKLKDKIDKFRETPIMHVILGIGIVVTVIIIVVFISKKKEK